MHALGLSRRLRESTAYFLRHSFQGKLAIPKGFFQIRNYDGSRWFAAVLPGVSGISSKSKEVYRDQELSEAWTSRVGMGWSFRKRTLRHGKAFLVDSGHDFCLDSAKFLFVGILRCNICK